MLHAHIGSLKIHIRNFELPKNILRFGCYNHHYSDTMTDARRGRHHRREASWVNVQKCHDDVVLSYLSDSLFFRAPANPRCVFPGKLKEGHRVQ